MSHIDPIYGQIIITLVTIIPVSIGFVWAIKTDTKVLKTRLDIVDNKLDKMDGVLIALAEQKGMQARFDDRLLMTGARLDELAKRFNGWVDDRDSNKYSAIKHHD